MPVDAWMPKTGCLKKKKQGNQLENQLENQQMIYWKINWKINLLENLPQFPWLDPSGYLDQLVQPFLSPGRLGNAQATA